MYYAYQYILANEGVDTATGYPYRGKVCCPNFHPAWNDSSHLLQQSSCYYDPLYNGVTISGNIQIRQGDEFSLLAAVASAGPVAVGVDASSKAFRVSWLTFLLQPTANSSCAFPAAVLLLWCVQPPWLLQPLPHTRHGHHRLWCLRRQGILAGEKQVIVSAVLLGMSLANCRAHVRVSMLHTLQCGHHFCMGHHSIYSHMMVLLSQLWQELGHEWLHHDVQKPVQSVWNCF